MECFVTWTDAELLSRARELLDKHGLDDWTVQLDHARRRAGRCSSHERTISLSKVLLSQYPATGVDHVILHEIAHALVGPGHGHDATWKAMARRLGTPPKARLDSALPTPEAPWVGTCPRCGTQRRLFRQPRRVTACGTCSRSFRPELILQWTFHGTPTTPKGPYARELSRLP
ncbi:DUF45 domain-containing protein [Actinomycetaceae bacterium WB03_NA08]|uniref:DUF45 domain-containing protein n=1 Tax=Scrofimicrobium canadense TaxID=2652290 RepID=A0A6N7VTY3_9ACTO|nr:DUF45 domain-containing protein [Scrofimicrobium canadense]